MGVTDVAQRTRRSRPRRIRPSRWVPAVVGVAAAAAALGLGLSLTSSSTPTVTAQAPRPPHIMTAALVENGETVGKVMTFGGDKPWMSMMFADSTIHGKVDCVVVTKDGRTHDVGTFKADDGYGAWIAPLHHVDPQDVHKAEVVSPSGTVIATATLG
jgi:hypothetical protein